ncbi:hypothetical protein M758_7G167800 [Ceratodon purpureus]|nr:hypothetical protein M758_7G167800 [Ceratodon purpureus]
MDEKTQRNSDVSHLTIWFRLAWSLNNGRFFSSCCDSSPHSAKSNAPPFRFNIWIFSAIVCNPFSSLSTTQQIKFQVKNCKTTTGFYLKVFLNWFGYLTYRRSF